MLLLTEEEEEAAVVEMAEVRFRLEISGAKVLCGTGVDGLAGRLSLWGSGVLVQATWRLFLTLSI